MEQYRLRELEQKMIENMPVPMAVYRFADGEVHVLAITEGYLSLFEFPDFPTAYRYISADVFCNAHPDDTARIIDAAYRFAAEGGRYEVVFRSRKYCGSDYHIIHGIGKHIYSGDGIRLAYVWYTDEGTYTGSEDSQATALNRVFNTVLHEESVLRASYYSYLTGLPSMSYFFELASSTRDTMIGQGRKPALFYIDLSGMKHFNLKYGFAQGDMLLKAFALCLSELFPDDVCSHFGADHFTVITEAHGINEKLDVLFENSRELNDGNNLPVHVGIYQWTDEIISVSEACDRAKTACDTLKNTYASAFVYYDKRIRDAEENRQYIIEHFDRAMEEKWIRVYLQPIIRAVNERVCDVEALARWIDPEKGVLSPASFIPVLEDAGLIYKLDLYMVDRILDFMKDEEANGFFLIPHSVNLSRIDFEACDIVEEIRKRVDKAGVSRDRLTIEITESVIGSDFDFMKEQVERFRRLGFPVWMDDFGSGYSSLDVLQSIRFDLIKFDMSFMGKLDEGDNGKIILTELIKLAASLGLDTVCEGVETREQVRFLREIGCSKLQGFYYSRPISIESLLEIRTSSTVIERENPKESEYYESIGRVNLFDLDVITSNAENEFQEENALRHVIETLPIAVLEIRDNNARYIRSNRSYQEYARRFFGVDIEKMRLGFSAFTIRNGTTFSAAVKQCCSSGSSLFFDEQQNDGSVVHSFVRRISSNPVTGSVAVAIVVLSVMESNDESRRLEKEKKLYQEKTSLGRIAALSPDYIVLYTVDPETNHYTQYSPSTEFEDFGLAKQGEDFFADVILDAPKAIAPEDMERHLQVLTKENMLAEIQKTGSFTHHYRIVMNGKYVPASLKATMVEEADGKKIILGVTNDEYGEIRRKLEEAQKINELNQTITSLLDNMPGMTFTKDAETGVYLACNQAFADYAHKATPDGVVGLTDAEIFDAETAAHFVEDDRLALSMEKPYIFFEDVPDAVGRQRQFQTTKLKYTDPSGRLCLQGMCQDVTDMIRIQRENATTKEAYRQASSMAAIYNHIAHALARGCMELYYVNMDTKALIEFHTDDKRGVLSEARRGKDFFENCEREAKKYLHPEDQEKFLKAMNREFLAKALEEDNVFELVYRIMKNGTPFYVQMNVSRMEDDKRIVVIAVSDIDELMRQRRAQQRIQEERQIYARLHAITGNFIVVYVVDPETNRYREFSATADYEKSFFREKEGLDFFHSVRKDAQVFAHPKDLDRFLSVFTKENVLAEIERSGIFTWGYRILMNGRPIYVQMKAAMVEEQEGPRLIVGLNDVDMQVRQEEEFERRLAQAQSEASIDALTGVKNKHAYLVAETEMDKRIADQCQSPFAVAIFDVNDLKKINDSAGHQAGDRYLCDACKIICEIFKRSPVFRVGGDEFAVIAQGRDFVCIEERLEMMRRHNEAEIRAGGIVIACGMAKYENDDCVAAVFERADHRMYQNKNDLKTKK